MNRQEEVFPWCATKVHWLVALGLIVASTVSSAQARDIISSNMTDPRSIRFIERGDGLADLKICERFSAEKCEPRALLQGLNPRQVSALVARVLASQYSTGQLVGQATSACVGGAVLGGEVGVALSAGTLSVVTGVTGCLVGSLGAHIAGVRYNDRIKSIAEGIGASLVQYDGSIDSVVEVVTWAGKPE